MPYPATKQINTTDLHIFSYVFSILKLKLLYFISNNNRLFVW